MKLATLLFTALLGLAGSAALAANPPPAATGAGPEHAHQGPCEKNPAECKADAAKFDQWCSANADKCIKLKSWAEKRIERCEKNPEKCKEMREKMKERREEHRADKQDQQNGQDQDQNRPDNGGDQPPPPVF